MEKFIAGTFLGLSIGLFINGLFVLDNQIKFEEQAIERGFIILQDDKYHLTQEEVKDG